MTQADSVHSTPPINASATDALYPPTDVTPEQIFVAIGKLRKDARDEIERLLAFLDSTDNHMELEPSLGWPEGHHDQSADEIEDGHIGETDDREDDGHAEPSLGFLERHCSLYGPRDGRDRSGDQSADQISRGLGGDLEDEHDGREPDEADDEPSIGYDHGSGMGEMKELDSADDEPSLGWTVDGCVGNTSVEGCDVEDGIGARLPQARTAIPGADAVHVEQSYRKFLHGLPEAQRDALQERMREDSGVRLGWR